MTASVLSRSARSGSSAVVLEQDYRLDRGLEGERAGLGVVGDGLCLLRVRVRLLEESGDEFQPQHAAHRCVELVLRNPSLRECERQQGIGLPIRQIEVDACLERTDRGAQRIGSSVMHIDQLLDREVVADDCAFEAHFAAQHVVQQPAIRVGGDAVDLVVRRHHRLRIAAPHRGAERREEDLAQNAFGDVGRSDIACRSSGWPCPVMCFSVASTRSGASGRLRP